MDALRHHLVHGDGWLPLLFIVLAIVRLHGNEEVLAVGTQPRSLGRLGPLYIKLGYSVQQVTAMGLNPYGASEPHGTWGQAPIFCEATDALCLGGAWCP